MRLLIVLAFMYFLWKVDRTMFICLLLLEGAALCVVLYIQTVKDEKEAERKQKAEREKAFRELQEWDEQFYTDDDEDDDSFDDDSFI